MDRFNVRGRRLLAVMGLALLAICIAVPVVQAFEGRGGDAIIIKDDEVIDDDLYVTANEFTLNGTVKGDLFVVGSTIEINGTVEGDLVAAGQTVVINGVVKDDLRIAGFALSFDGDAADDLIAVGFSLENGRESSVGGDLLFAGYQALLDGEVTGSVDLGGNAVEIAATIGGDVNVDVSDAEPGETLPPGFPFAPTLPRVRSIPGGLTIDEGASIGGDLNYTAAAEAAIPSGVVAGKTAFTRYVLPEPGEEDARKLSPVALAARWLVGHVRRLITLLLVGAAMIWLVPDWTRKVADIVHTRPLPSLGWGVVAIGAYLLAMLVLIIVTVLLIIVLGVVTLGELAGRFAVLGGIVMGTTAFGFSVTWAYITKIVISLLLGQLIFGLFKSTVAEHRWWPTLLGVLVFIIITAIPVLGWLAKLAAVLLGLGAIWLWGRNWLESRKAAPVAVEAKVPPTPPTS